MKNVINFAIALTLLFTIQSCNKTECIGCGGGNENNNYINNIILPTQMTVGATYYGFVTSAPVECGPSTVDLETTLVAFVYNGIVDGQYSCEVLSGTATAVFAADQSVANYPQAIGGPIKSKISGAFLSFPFVGIFRA